MMGGVKERKGDGGEFNGGDWEGGRGGGEGEAGTISL